jgi:hypothetical protein
MIKVLRESGKWVSLFLLVIVTSCNRTQDTSTLSSANHINSKEDSTILIPNPKHKITLFQANYLFKADFKDYNFHSFESLFGKYARSKPWTPSVTQILQLEANIFNLIKNYKAHSDTINLEYSSDFRNELSEGLNFILANLDNYNRQYTSCLKSDNTKIIHINFYLKDSAAGSYFPPANLPDSSLISVMGGGAAFFTMSYNFDLNKVMDVTINSSM